MLGPSRKEVRLYVDERGNAPFEKWLERLKDGAGKAVIRARIDRLEEGNSGKCGPVGRGVFELKIYFGPGYRIYFGEDGGALIILLIGGDKSTQRRDIWTAHQYWKNYKERTYESIQELP